VWFLGYERLSEIKDTLDGLKTSLDKADAVMMVVFVVVVK
jgi:hypothetical protein